MNGQPDRRLDASATVGRSLRLLGLGGLIFANLALTFLLWWQYRSPVMRFVALGVPVCQVLLLAVWLGLGDSRWYWRLAVAVSLTLLVGQSMALGASRQRLAWRTGAPEVTTFFSLGLLELVLVGLALLLPLRHLRGWRLTWDSTVAAAKTSRFRIADLMIWMIPLGVALGVPRGLASLDTPPVMEITLVTLVLALGLLPVVWPAVLTSFSTQRRGRKTVCLACWTLSYGGAIAIASVIMLLLQLRAMRSGALLPWWAWFTESAAPLLLFAATTALTLLNCLALRGLGMRLVRPTREARVATTSLAPAKAAPRPTASL